MLDHNNLVGQMRWGRQAGRIYPNPGQPPTKPKLRLKRKHWSRVSTVGPWVQVHACWPTQLSLFIWKNISRFLVIVKKNWNKCGWLCDCDYELRFRKYYNHCFRTLHFSAGLLSTVAIFLLCQKKFQFSPRRLYLWIYIAATPLENKCTDVWTTDKIFFKWALPQNPCIYSQ